MNDAPNDDLRPTAEAFCKSPGPKMEALLPHRTAVLELRGKGASFALIARLLERIGILVSTDTLRRLCARSSWGACNRSPGEQTPSPPQPTPKVPAAPAISPNAPRGPRIADPSTQ
jgi:hypothetical protein